MAYNQEPLDKTPVIKFNSQDFNSLQDHCLSRSLPFEDETFPAETSSIGLKLLQGKNLSSLRWMWPKVSEPLRNTPSSRVLLAACHGASTETRMGPCPGFQGWPKPSWKENEIYLVPQLQCCTYP